MRSGFDSSSGALLGAAWFSSASHSPSLQEDAAEPSPEPIRKAARTRTTPRPMGASLENIAKDYIRFPVLTEQAPRRERTDRKSSFRNRHAAPATAAVRDLGNHRQTA